ncbi:MAG: NgoPII family restriction endonuclease [Clostridia bacterium]|nr:NgoPII family restriction endonuclease [Clostridia bacterium]
MSNIIDAIINLVNNPVVELKSTYSGRNRANNMGDALEEYVKDLFAGTFACEDAAERLEKISRTFSYLGNTSNPPDAMLRGGDAIEVKKIESDNSDLALNSSHPKHILNVNSDMISNACKTAEQWSKKDIIYIVGIVHQNQLRHMCMVYGLDYCASEQVYGRLKQIIRDGIQQIPYIELAPTHELGRLNRVDPLGITYLRVRGMWGIENPFKVFEYVYRRDMSKKFNFMAIIRTDKYNSFGNAIQLEQVASENRNLKISDVRIKDPDNPAVLNNAKLITYVI